jgi:hypothetical protein
MKSGSEMYYDEHCTIETQNSSFNPLAPTFNIEDIAGGLSRKCRFNGQCSRYYSVAEHSLLVSKLMQEEYGGDPLEGLLHDASEAYLPDVPSPYKHVLPDLSAMDARVEEAMRKHYRLAPRKTQACAKADMTALFIEAALLLPSRGAGALWEPIIEFRPEAMRLAGRFKPQFLDPVTAQSLFLVRYSKLVGDAE